MSALEIKKLVRIMNDNFVMPEASDLKYEELVADQQAVNGLISSSLEKCVISQYSRSSMGQNPRILWRVLREIYHRDLVLNSDNMQEQNMNLRLENERSIAKYVDILRQLYRGL